MSAFDIQLLADTCGTGSGEESVRRPGLLAPVGDRNPRCVTEVVVLICSYSRVIKRFMVVDVNAALQCW